MSSHLGVDQTLELLDRLKGTVHDFAEREEKLEQDFRIRIGRVRQRRNDAVEEVENELVVAIGVADAESQTTKQAVEARYARRQSRITEAHQAAKKKRLADTDEKEGRRKHRLQTETLQSRRDRETGLATTESTLAEFKAALAEDNGTLAGLEASALNAFRGFRQFVRAVAAAPEKATPNLAPDEYQLIAELRELQEKTGTDLARFRRYPLPFLFKFTLLWVALVLAQAPLAYGLMILGIQGFTLRMAGMSTVGCLVLGFVLHFVGKRHAAPLAASLAAALGKAHRMHDACAEKAETRRVQEIERIEGEFAATSERISKEWNEAIEEATAERAFWPQQVDSKGSRAFARNDETLRVRLEALEAQRAAAVESLRQQSAARSQELTDTAAANEAKLNAERDALWRPLVAEWKSKIQPLYETIQAAHADAENLFPAWQPELWEGWKPPQRFGHAAKFAHLQVDVEKLSGGVPKDPRLAIPGASRFPLPLLLNYPQAGSVLLETTQTGRDEMIAALNNIVLRLLSASPPGRLSFSIFDPVGLGQSFSGIMHLADAAEHLINSRIWTQTSQIEERLAHLNGHMEKVIQMYLRNEYATIAEYNEQAGNIAEKYHFLVVADFPVNFSDAAAKRLLSIAASGARCGVFTLIHWDRRQPMPQDFTPEELRKSSVCVTARGSDFILTGKSLPGTSLLLDAPPSPEFAIEFIQKIGLLSRDSNRVEVPFTHIAPPAPEVWSVETTSELRVPIGRTGATKLQYLAIGKGTRQHALLAGKTGSGKSTLFHVMITNLALWCSPEQVEFYLIDFKKGVEFKCYATHRLPHAKVVAIESDREFGLSVLQRIDDELKRRGDLFRQLGVQDVAGYKRSGGKEAMPRSLLIIDEFQEFFVEDDKIAQTASLLMDRIVRQGRAFGIHVLLGSQTLGGAYTVARTTLGQMVIRIALQCNEADAYLIMDDNNPAPRLLSRPGEGIYNDTAGTVEGNSPFQVVWLPDQERDDWLAQVRTRADQTTTASYPGPIVFEGNAPSDVRENPVLRKLLEAETIKPTVAPRIFLGAPNSIKGPTEAVFHRQSGNNLLLVGQRDEAVLAIMAVTLVSLAAQYSRGSVRIVLCDGTNPGTPQREFMERVVTAIPHPITVAKQGDLGTIMQGLTDDMKKRTGDEAPADAPATFLVIHGLQKFNKLRYEEDFGFAGGDADAAPNPAALLNNLITECTRLGFHVIATCDTYNNVNRFLSRKAFSEFEMRVLFQMSANDSASLIDSPKASTLGLHRALFYNEQEGYLETFRPYALPAREWVDQVAAQLRRLLG